MQSFSTSKSHGVQKLQLLGGAQPAKAKALDSNAFIAEKSGTELIGAKY